MKSRLSECRSSRRHFVLVSETKPGRSSLATLARSFLQCRLDPTLYWNSDYAGSEYTVH